jgi:gamma-glutamylcyclotransferase
MRKLLEGRPFRRLSETRGSEAHFKMSTFFYFAYGSNMFTKRLTQRVNSARAWRTGFIAGYRLTFHKRSKDGSGKCDAEPTGSPDDRVYGVVYEVNAKQEPELDEAEGVGRKGGYKKTDVTVVCGTERICAKTYCATDKDPKHIPYAWYKELVLAGAREHHLPEAYIQQIEDVESKEDPNAERREKNLKILNSG